MYKCSECGKTFDKKPDYCDCGNDEFINDTPTVKEEKTNIVKKEVENTWFKDNLPSLCFLFVCIILSVVILLVKVNVPEKTVQHQQEKKETISKKVNWELFEDNQIKQTTPKNTVQQPVQPVVQQPVQKHVQNTVKNIQPKQVKKETKEIKQNKQTTQKTQAKTQVTQKSQPVQKPQTTQKTQQTQPVQKTTQSQTNVQQIPKVDTQKILNNYKNSVAKSFYAKINFGNVIGSGSCEVTFKVDSNGNVYNKSFSKLSSNTTLNDAVFNGVNIVSRVQTPPSEYKGETLRMQVGFNNGNYYIRVY